MDNFLNNLRYAARVLVRAPGFTLVAVVALALGIGANTAIFGVVNTLLLRPLPYADPGRLAVIWEVNPTGRDNPSNSPGNYLHWREMSASFDDMAAVSLTFRTTLSGHGEPEEVPMQYVSATVFPILGVAPQIGRTFTADEDQPNRNRVVVLSDRLWRRRFGGDPAVLNQVVRFDGDPYTIVGVMPPGFSILDKTVDLWKPVGFSAASRTPRGRWIQVVARVKRGVTFARAQQDMNRVQVEMIRLFPAFDTGWGIHVRSMKDQLTSDVRPALFVMLGAVGFVLLIACANVANLLLARATTRQREMAVRAALGAGRGRLVAQSLTESGLLSAAGGAVGLVLAWWAVAALRTTIAARVPVPRLEALAVDGWVLGFAFAIALLSGLAFGVIPALSAAGLSFVEALKEGGRTGTSRRGARIRHTFVVAETALALVLLVGAGLLVRSFVALMHVDAGFDPSQIITMKITLPTSKYDTSRLFFDQLYARIDALPGVQAAGGISFLPLNGLGAATSFAIAGRPAPAPGEEPVADVRVVTHDYFKAMRMPLLRGRLFDARDAGEARHRVIVSAELARKYFPNEDPIGKQLAISWTDKAPDEIIGVVGDVRQSSLDVEARPTTYWAPARFAYPWNSVVIRTSGDPVRIVPEVASIVREFDSTIAVADVHTMSDVVSISVAERRLTMLLLTIFAGLAVALAAVGIYGVISYSVTQRTQEIGIRMALGAQRGTVLRLVVAHAMTLASIGIGAGAAAAWVLTRLMQKLLFGVRPSDPVTFAAVSVLLAVVAAVAASVPGLRATRVDPVIALRSE
ncbi:MAG TPA: ABC transporter permease [Vicinamibacterales bacterium]|nr:ABC transporter permease [Vicinamibacterales bacterium]